MQVVVSMLRGVNITGNNIIKMDDLRCLYESLNLYSPRTFIQSGNVIFGTKARSLPALAKKLGDAIEDAFSFRPAVILRTREELREIVQSNPFSGRGDIHPSKLLVTFFQEPLEPSLHARVREIILGPEEFHMGLRESWVYFPNGIGNASFSTSKLERLCCVPGTGRNWNSVTKMLEIADSFPR